MFSFSVLFLHHLVSPHQRSMLQNRVFDRSFQIIRDFQSWVMHFFFVSCVYDIMNSSVSRFSSVSCCDHARFWKCRKRYQMVNHFSSFQFCVQANFFGLPWTQDSTQLCYFCFFFFNLTFFVVTITFFFLSCIVWIVETRNKST